MDGDSDRDGDRDGDGDGGGLPRTLGQGAGCMVP